MTIMERFLNEAEIGKQVELVSGPKEICGEIIAFDNETVRVKRKNNKVATIDLNTISYYEVFDDEIENENNTSNIVELTPTLKEKNSDASLKTHSMSKGSGKERTNDLENAIISRDKILLGKALDNRERLIELGYSVETLDRIDRMLQKGSGMSKGDDDYSIAIRLDEWQGNQNGTAEKFFSKSLLDKNIKGTHKDYAVKKLASYFISNNEYEEYLKLYDIYKKRLAISTGKQYIFHIEALKGAGRATEAAKVTVSSLDEKSIINIIDYIDGSPDANIANKVVYYLSHEVRFVKASERILRYIFNNGKIEEFERLRKELFVFLYPSCEIEQLRDLLAVGHLVEEKIKIVFSEDEDEDASNYELQDKDINTVVSEYLSDKTFGLIRASLYTKEKGIECEELNSAIQTAESLAEDDWNLALNNNDELEKQYLISKYEIVGINEDTLQKIREIYRGDESLELIKALVNYDEKKIKKIVSDENLLKRKGFSDKEIERFKNLITNHSFSNGGSPYEIASRLSTWGFINHAMKYYIEVANDPKAEKRKNAVNQIVVHAVGTKDVPLFEKYYELLEPKQKTNEVFLRFMNDCKYSHEEYEELYKIYLADKSTMQPSVIYGALRCEKDDSVKDELIDKACQMGSFDYVFWDSYLRELADRSIEQYRYVLNRVLNEHAAMATINVDKCYELIKLDSIFINDISEQMILNSMENGYPVVLPLLLYLKSNIEDNEVKEKIKTKIISTLNTEIENMEYRKAHEIGLFALRHFPDNDIIQEIVRVSEKGMDIYNMLPSGQDNYARGKRLLMLGEDPEKAFDCFKEEIENSDDTKNVALCGKELLKGLFEAERYADVIVWGRKLIIEGGVVEYSTLALDINNAFEQMNDQIGKESFVSDLALKAESMIDNNKFEEAIDRIRLIEIFDRNNVFVSKYSDLLDRIKTDNLNLDESTFAGRANVIKYVEKDDKKYIEYLKQGFDSGKVDNEKKAEIASLLLEAISTDENASANLEFIEKFSNYNVPLTEHIIDILYTIITRHKNYDYTIEYFSKLLDNSSADKRTPILSRLGRIYEEALRNNCEFNADNAVKQMLEYTQKNSSLQVKLCYIWLLAYAGNIDNAAELLSLIPDEKRLTEDQTEIVDGIVNTYFSGEKPLLGEIFANLIKNNTLYRLDEHCKLYKDFISFSEQEEKIHAELIKNTSYKVDPTSEIVKDAIIKTIYSNTLRYKFWYLYFLCVKNIEDSILLYCINTIMAILNTDINNTISEKNANFLLKNNSDVSMRYSGYRLYNKLYRLYIMKAYQKNPSVVKEIAGFSMDKKAFGSDPEMRKVLARDYIHLLKLLDDRDDYIYIKSAMFIATNNKCEEYFYNLFQKDLLYREPIICLKMCMELVNREGAVKDFCRNVLDSLKEANKEHEGIISVLLYENSHLGLICRLLKDYPAIPNDDYVRQTLQKYENDPTKSIPILEAVDKCYSDAIMIKKRLLILYRMSSNRDYYEKMYQCILCLIKVVADEDALYELCRMSVLLAVSLGKNNRIADVYNIYEKQSLDLEHMNDLQEFCNAFYEFDTDNDTSATAFFDALITDNWSDLFANNGIGFLCDKKNIGCLIDFSKMPFVQSVFSYSLILKEAKQDKELKKFLRDVDIVSQRVFGEQLSIFINKMLEMPSEDRSLFVSNMNLFGKNNPLRSIPDNKELINLALDLWNVVYGEDKLIERIVETKGNNAGYKTLCKIAIIKFCNSMLLSDHTQTLFANKDYKTIISLQKDVEWSLKDVQFSAYFAVSLLLVGKDIALDYVSKLDGEAYVNVILLLKKQMLNEEIRKICLYAPSKREETNLIESVIEKPGKEQLSEIEQNYSGNMEMALLKLLYSRTEDDQFRRKLQEKYRDSVTTNSYIAVWSTSREEDKEAYFFESSDTEDDFSEESNQNIDKNWEYVDETLQEVSLEEYSDGIKRGEVKKISDIYDSIGVDISENTEYRKELLAKLIFISSKHNDEESYIDYSTKLGVVLFYNKLSTDSQKARTILFETIQHLTDYSKRNTVELARKALCDSIGSYNSVDEIVNEKMDLIKSLNNMRSITRAIEFSTFFQKMIDYTETVSEIVSSSDISQRTTNYQKISRSLKTNITKSSNRPLFNQAYTKWYRLTQAEIKKLSKGAVLNLEVETTQCSTRGKICCVIQNVGKKAAENISVKVIFDDSIRCKDNEKEFKVIYGGDTVAFAFSIRCREEGVHSCKIEVSFEIAQVIEQIDCQEEIRIVRESEYEHIGNLYSVAPVTSNSEFYGREREKEEILSFLDDVKYNTSIVMHGLKRVGKTSMLRYIERTMRDSTLYIPVYKSAQGIGEQNAIRNMFVKTIIDELDSIGSVDDKCRSYLEYDYDKNPEQLYDFYTYLQKTNILNGKRILFMADEIEEIFDMVDQGIISKRIYKVLRVILQELTSIRFIFCGADHLTDILYNHALADVFEITKRIIISRLDEESMQRMIVEPATDKLSYTDRAVERIWYYTKGHTFYSKHICSKIIDILNEESRATAYAYDVDMAVKQVMRVTEYFIYLSRFFSENDKQVIKIICDNTKFSKDRVSLDTLEDNYDGGGLSDSLTGLEFKDILEKTEGYDTDYYQFSIEMFRLWYSKAEFVSEA